MRSRWFGLGVAILLIAFTVAVFPRLPAQIPTHWDLSGRADGWSPKFPGIVLLPLTVLGTWASGWFLPHLDPRREYERFGATWWLLINVVTLFLGLMGVLVLGVGLGWPIDIGMVGPLLTGVLFVGLGNYLPRVRANWWLGVRTPWTLSSDHVWQRTHRLAGWTFVVGGLLMMATVFLPRVSRGWVMPLAVIVAALVPVVYSYLVWREEMGGPDTAHRQVRR